MVGVTCDVEGKIALKNVYFSFLKIFIQDLFLHLGQLRYFVTKPFGETKSLKKEISNLWWQCGQ